MESASSLSRTTLNCHMTPRWTTSLYIQRAMQKLSSCYTLYKSGDLLVAGLSIFNFNYSHDVIGECSKLFSFSWHPGYMPCSHSLFPSLASTRCRTIGISPCEYIAVRREYNFSVGLDWAAQHHERHEQ